MASSTIKKIFLGHTKPLVKVVLQLCIVFAWLLFVYIEDKVNREPLRWEWSTADIVFLQFFLFIICAFAGVFVVGVFSRNFIGLLIGDFLIGLFVYGILAVLKGADFLMIIILSNAIAILIGLFVPRICNGLTAKEETSDS